MVITSTRSAEKTFICRAQAGAMQVFLAGDFNSWNTTNTPMMKSRDGTWRAKVKLPPGEHQYKFYVDGQWLHDPDAERQVMNRFGSLNSVVRVY